MSRSGGRVYLVGAGPGDPGLLTRRGLEILARADVVIHDALASRVLLEEAPPRAERIDAGKRHGRRHPSQAEVNRLMVARARRGLTVVRLKGGDPSLFGRAGEETEALAAARVPFAIVPGVTAAAGAAAAAAIPLTDRRYASSVVLATGHEDPGKGGTTVDWSWLARAETLVLYMAVGRLARICRRLIAHGRSAATPALVVRWATRPDGEVIEGSLGDIAARARRKRLTPPAVLITGGVVRLRRRLVGRRTHPLADRTLVVTRAREQAGPLIEALTARGARVIAAPAIAFAPPRSYAPLDRALRRLPTYDLVIFTSANGVDRFFERLRRRRVDLRTLRGTIAAIGPATAAAVGRLGLRVALVPEEYRAEGLLRALRVKRGMHVLIPRAAVARDLLPRTLRRAGARVDVTPVYRTVRSREGTAPLAAAVRRGAIDLVLFTSSSTVTHFVEKLPPRLRRRLRGTPAACIGPITAATARAHGFRIAAIPRDYTVPALVTAVETVFRNSPSGTPRDS
ncbi:MAG: uroporphyrinogen-III C-methyltransferase [Candidatus Polarisedimenticolia bacterium]